MPENIQSSNSLLLQRLRQALPLMPEHKLHGGARKNNLHLDAMLDEARLSGNMDADTFDYLLTAYRLKEPFENCLRNFCKRDSVKPAQLKDLWQLAFGAWATRTQVPFEAIANDVVQFSAELFGPTTKSATNAFCRYLTREGTVSLERFKKSPELMITPEMRKLFGPEKGLSARMGRSLWERPEKGVAVFSRSGDWFRVDFADFLAQRSQLQAMDQGSWLFCQWAFQQIVSQFPPHLYNQNQPLRVLDACCAPGGKLMALHNLMLRKGYHLKTHGTDAKFSRLERVKENLQAWNLSSEISLNLQDWRHTPKEGNSFDVIVADLPCSASGTLGSQPDLLYANWTERLEELMPLQKNLITNLKQHLAPNALLIVCVCSVLPKETQALEKFLGPSTTKFFSFSESELNMEGLKAWAWREESHVKEPKRS